jgi:hypothetical protein
LGQLFLRSRRSCDKHTRENNSKESIFGDSHMHLRERQKHFTPREWVVLSSQPADLSRTQRGIVEQMDGPPAEIVAKLEACGARHLYVDGDVESARSPQRSKTSFRRLFNRVEYVRRPRLRARGEISAARPVLGLGPACRG